MPLDYASLRTEALATCVLPAKFESWPQREQAELLRLAELSLAETRREITRLVRTKPDSATALEATAAKVEALLRAIRVRMHG